MPSIAAPTGSHWVMGEVRTAKGTESLGEVPLLEWESLATAENYYGEEGVLNALHGTSLTVAYQAIARRAKGVGKSEDEIATLVVNYKPGARQVGASTPVSRARNAAARVAEKVGGDNLAKALELLGSGTIDLSALLAQHGIAAEPVAAENSQG